MHLISRKEQFEMTQHDDRLIYMVFTTQQKLKLYIRDEMKASGVKITLVQAGILFLLKENNDRPMNEISRLLSLDNSTITGLADRLEKSGFLKRIANPADRRMSFLHVTDKGVVEAEKAETIINRINGEIKAGFTENELGVFKKVLSGLIGKSHQ